MNELIFEGILVTKEYRKLSFRKGRTLFISYLVFAILGVTVLFLSLLGLILDYGVWLRMRYLFFALYLVFWTPALAIMTYNVTHPGFCPLGEAKVYRTSPTTLRVEWSRKGKNHMELLRVRRSEIIGNYTYLEENKMRYLFLPKEIKVF